MCSQLRRASVSERPLKLSFSPITRLLLSATLSSRYDVIGVESELCRLASSVSPSESEPVESLDTETGDSA